MSDRTVTDRSRRGFLATTLALAGSLRFIPTVGSASALPEAEAGGMGGSEPGYRSLNADEAAFTEKMVNTLCPADRLTPDGVSCGLARFIDCHLAGDFNDDQDWSAHGGQRQLFKAGVAAAGQACHQRFGVAFDQLAASDAGNFLRDIAAGLVPHEFPLAAWSSEVVDPILTRACFTGPVYDAHGARMFWKLFGYVSGPAEA